MLAFFDKNTARKQWTVCS